MEENCYIIARGNHLLPY